MDLVDNIYHTTNPGLAWLRGQFSLPAVQAQKPKLVWILTLVNTSSFTFTVCRMPGDHRLPLACLAATATTSKAIFVSYLTL